MTRLTNLIADKMQREEKLLSVFLTAGYPELGSAPELVRLVEEAGADFVELGIPFSDPIADGPVIQHSSQVALANGINLKEIMQQVRQIRKNSSIPLILMGYLNPIIKYGLRDFLGDAESAGVDGLIIPDLIPEEYDRLRTEFESTSVGINFLVSPNTARERVRKIARLTQDFVYCVAVTGITGARQGVADETVAFLQEMRKLITRPCFVGFGISSAQDASRIAALCDGVIVGSAITKLLNVPNINRVLYPFAQQFQDLRVEIVDQISPVFNFHQKLLLKRILNLIQNRLLPATGPTRLHFSKVIW